MMRYSSLIKIILIPVLLPLSVIYSLLAFLNRIISSSYKSSSFVLSVGNYQVGGTGKSPVVLELVKTIYVKGLKPVIISKSYKALLKTPKQVLESDRALEVGDEALMMKKNFPNALVFSGPSKVQTLKFAERELGYDKSRVFILDDGAQHHRLFKDMNVILWDASRSVFDLFAFPLGLSRECMFFSKRANHVFMNRGFDSLLGKMLKFFYGARLKSLNYEVKTIENQKHELLNKNAHLVSGVGNFQALKEKVESFIGKKGLSLKSTYKASDHDTFKNFKAKPDEFYICTEKDHDKLREKINSANLYVVKSFFDDKSKEYIHSIVNDLEEKMSDDKD